jgi:hypothetical protein
MSITILLKILKILILIVPEFEDKRKRKGIHKKLSKVLKRQCPSEFISVCVSALVCLPHKVSVLVCRGLLRIFTGDEPLAAK